jgi:hypothetical protein
MDGGVPMKRRALIQKLETSEATLARLRGKRARLDAEIARLEECREADVLGFVVDTAKRLNVGQLPVASILRALDELARSASGDRPVLNARGTSANASDGSDRGLIEVFVRLTRNTSETNREALESAGLHWNGRSAGWTGRVAPETLERLRGIFKERVQVGADAGRSAAVSRGEANGSPVDTEAKGASLAVPEEPVEAETIVPAAEPEDVSAAALLPTPFRLPLRPNLLSSLTKAER